MAKRSNKKNFFLKDNKIINMKLSTTKKQPKSNHKQKMVHAPTNQANLIKILSIREIYYVEDDSNFKESPEHSKCKQKKVSFPKRRNINNQSNMVSH